VEGKLAETAPKRPLALTIGAAAATLLVILGVLSGPAIVSCFNSEEGLGFCLRGKMADVGLAPPLPAPAVAEAESAVEAPAAEVNVATTEEAVSAEPELDVTPPAETLDVAAADGVIAATFGLLRAEPDGSIVIAGSGTPGSLVEVYANGELLGTVEVEASGDWVFVPDAPLAPGDLEITLGEEGKAGTAEQSFIVVLNEDRTTQPLVVASTPGQASEVLQGLTAPAAQIASAPEAEPATETETMDVAIATPPAAEPEADQPQTDAATPPDAAPAVEPATEPAPVVAPAAPEPATSEPTAAAPETPADAVETDPAATEVEATEPEATEPEATEPAITEPEPAAIALPETSVATAPSTEANATEEPLATAPEPAAVPEQPAQPAATQTATVAPTIDAIELDGDRTFFAGAGPEDGIVRLYVDDTFIDDAAVAEGRWLIEAGPVLDQPSQRVRIDLLQPDNAQVMARAEVDFMIDLPAGASGDIVVADAETPAPPAETPAPPAATPPAEVSEPALIAEPIVPAEPVDQPQETLPAAPGPAPADVPARPPVIAPAPQPAPAAAPAAEPAPTEPAPAAPEPAAPEPVAEPAVPTMVAVSLGDPEAQRFASGKAIIRRGDNLWTIARRVYGEGVKYTTIYEANNAQIRDPDRIYPGQVFDLPGGE
jgi:hypothetical protein